MFKSIRYFQDAIELNLAANNEADISKNVNTLTICWIQMTSIALVINNERNEENWI